MDDRPFKHHSWDELREVKAACLKGSRKHRKEAERKYKENVEHEWLSNLEAAERWEDRLRLIEAEYTARRESKARRDRERTQSTPGGDSRPPRRHVERNPIPLPSATAPSDNLRPDEPTSALARWFSMMKMDDQISVYHIWQIDRRIYLGKHAGGHMAVYVETPFPTQDSIAIVERHWLPANNPSELGRSLDAIASARRRRESG